MHVMGVALDTKTGTPIIVLSDKENRRALPIWIGSAEASSIIRYMEKIKPERPMTHDLICTLIDEMDYNVKKIEINDVNSSTYFANIFLVGPKNKTLIVDSRPSDAISIALRANAPIYATTNVIAEGSVSTNKEKDQKEAEEFKEFIQDLKPSDFTKSINDNQESNQ